MNDERGPLTAGDQLLDTEGTADLLQLTPRALEERRRHGGDEKAGQLDRMASALERIAVVLERWERRDGFEADLRHRVGYRPRRRSGAAGPVALAAGRSWIVGLSP